MMTLFESQSGSEDLNVWAVKRSPEYGLSPVFSSWTDTGVPPLPPTQG